MLLTREAMIYVKAVLLAREFSSLLPEHLIASNARKIYTHGLKGFSCGVSLLRRHFHITLLRSRDLGRPPGQSNWIHQ